MIDSETTMTNSTKVFKNWHEYDENVKDMRETARAIGLTQLLIDISNSPAMMGTEDIDRLADVLEMLGVTLDEVGSNSR